MLSKIKTVFLKKKINKIKYSIEDHITEENNENSSNEDIDQKKNIYILYGNFHLTHNFCFNTPFFIGKDTLEKIKNVFQLNFYLLEKKNHFFDLLSNLRLSLMCLKKEVYFTLVEYISFRQYWYCLWTCPKTRNYYLL